VHELHGSSATLTLDQEFEQYAAACGFYPEDRVRYQLFIGDTLSVCWPE
jgi:hypothetical protein